MRARKQGLLIWGSSRTSYGQRCGSTRRSVPALQESGRLPRLRIAPTERQARLGRCPSRQLTPPKRFSRCVFRGPASRHRLYGPRGRAPRPSCGGSRAQMPLFHIERDLAEGRLRRVLDDHAVPPGPASVLYPRNRQLSPRVPLFMDWVAGQFARHAGEAVFLR